MENIDIEELEAMLYGQVFHGYAERMNEENGVSTVTIETYKHGTTCSMIQGQKYFKRYFQSDARGSCEKTDLTRKPQFSKTYPNSTVITCDTTNTPIINKITINQYSCSPLHRNSETAVPQEKQTKTTTRKGKKTKRKKRQAQVPIKETKIGKSSKKVTKEDDVICLSDSDTEDCVVVLSPTPVKNVPIKLNRGSVLVETSDAEAEDSDDNDDIIYIAPPPVPVINIDPDSENENSQIHIQQDMELVCSLDTSASNDFLDEENSQMLPDKFNFTLQANDFDQGDFVRPSNPSEVYQTSESSTSEQRDFNNSVKTIVFNEVEFPQADLFSETNLETFGLYITPKKVTKSPETSTGRDHGKNNKETLCASDSSSSESDYTPQELASNRKGSSSKSIDLPTLCPMQLPTDENTETGKPKKSKKKTAEKYAKNAEGETEPVEKSAKGIEKTKKTSLSDKTDEDTEDIQKTSKTKKSSVKKKRHSKNSSSSEPQNVNDVSETSVSSAEVMPKKKRPSKSSQSDETIDNSDNNTSSNNKKRKKPSKQDNDSYNDNLMSEATVDTPGNDSEGKLPESQTQKDISVDDNDEDVAVNNEAPQATTMPPREVLFDHSAEQPLDDTTQFMELTVVDAVSSDREEVEIIDDSSSNEDFRTLDDVGNELALANTSLFVETLLGEDGTNDFSKFDVKSLQQTMTDDPQFWQISAKDRAQLYAIKEKGPRCMRCRQRGHLAFRCPNKPGVPSCSLCGREGHLEPRCPNRVCFQCACNSSFSTTSCWKCAHYRSNICTVCHTMGHNIHVCPDLWRRYHLTTTPGPVIVSNGPSLKPRNELWCAGCAQQGHLDFECNSYCYNREYSGVSPAVFEYSDVYNVSSSDYSNTSRINPLSLMRHIPNQPEESFVQENRSIFQLPRQGGTSQNLNVIPPLMSMTLNQQVINPFSIFNNLTLNQSGSSNQIVELSQNNMVDESAISPNIFRNYSMLFTNGPISELQHFIHSEVTKLGKVNEDIKDLKKKYYTIQHLRNKSMQTSSYVPKKFLKRISEFYRRVNMFIFGVHQFRNGKKNLDYLRNFLALAPSSKLTVSKRDNLRLAYEYIFAGVAHNDTDYIKVLTQIYINKSRKRRH